MHFIFLLNGTFIIGANEEWLHIPHSKRKNSFNTFFFPFHTRKKMSCEIDSNYCIIEKSKNIYINKRLSMWQRMSAAAATATKTHSTVKRTLKFSFKLVALNSIVSRWKNHSCEKKQLLCRSPRNSFLFERQPPQSTLYSHRCLSKKIAKFIKQYIMLKYIH